MSITQKISNIFAAGCIGGLLNSITVWIFGAIGITTALGVKIAPQLTPPWLYPRIVWGGVWGILFLIPILKTRLLLKGLLLSLGPTLVQLFIVFPLKAKKGTMGIELGVLTPVFVIAFNAVWGLTAAWWLKWIGKEEP